MLRQTVSIFSQLAHIKIRDDGEYWLIVFSDIKCPEDLLPKELENYLIDLSCKIEAW